MRSVPDFDFPSDAARRHHRPASLPNSASVSPSSLQSANTAWSDDTVIKSRAHALPARKLSVLDPGRSSTMPLMVAMSSYARSFTAPLASWGVGSASAPGVPSPDGDLRGFGP